MRKPYQAPRIVDEQLCEAQAMACNKVPGLGALNFCGAVWINSTGFSGSCSMNPDSRSS